MLSFWIRTHSERGPNIIDLYGSLQVASFDAPGVTVAGCTLNTNGAVRILQSSSDGADGGDEVEAEKPTFAAALSATELTFASSTQVKRNGTSGCYPLAAVLVPSSNFSLAIKMVSTTSEGNSFSFGVAQKIRKTYGDGFGLERTSIGLFQVGSIAMQCTLVIFDPTNIWCAVGRISRIYFLTQLMGLLGVSAELHR